MLSVVVRRHTEVRNERRYGNATQTLSGRTQQEPRRRLLLFYATNVHPQDTAELSFSSSSFTHLNRPYSVRIVCMCFFQEGGQTDQGCLLCGMSNCPQVTALSLTLSTDYCRWEFGPNCSRTRNGTNKHKQRNLVEWQRVGQHTEDANRI